MKRAAKGVLYLRTDDRNRPDFLSRGARPFRYGGASGMVTVPAYYEAPDDILDDDRQLSAEAARALQAAESGRTGGRRRGPGAAERQ